MPLTHALLPPLDFPDGLKGSFRRDVTGAKIDSNTRTDYLWSRFALFLNIKETPSRKKAKKPDSESRQQYH